MEDRPPQRNAFEEYFSSKNTIKTNYIDNVEFLIKSERYEEARTILDENIKDNADPTKQYYIELINERLDECTGTSEYDGELSDVSRGEYDGTDIRRIQKLELRMDVNEASKKEIKEVLTFWNSYPEKKTFNFRIKILIEVWHLNYNINPKLISRPCKIQKQKLTPK